MQTISSASELHKKIQEHALTLVDFFGDNCGPCKSMEVILSTVEGSLPAQVTKFNVGTDNYLTASQLQIRSVPTLILFKAGKQIARHVGTASPQGIKDWVAANKA